MANRPSPFTALFWALLSIGFWILCVWQWFQHNDHWALFWFAWCISCANAANMSLLRYRRVL